MAKIEGLPEGVELVRFGICGPDDFEITHERVGGSDPVITKGPRAGAQAQVIVKPADGYRFALMPSTFDIRAFKELPEHWEVFKVLAQPREIAASFRFKVETEQDTQIVEKALESLRKLPGFVEPA